MIIAGDNDRQIHNNNNKAFRTNNNLEDREDKFGVQIVWKYVYRVPLKYFCNLGKINFPTKKDLKTPYPKTCELQVGSQEFDVDFIGYKRQFDWLKTSLVYNKGDKHKTISDSL